MISILMAHDFYDEDIPGLRYEDQDDLPSYEVPFDYEDPEYPSDVYDLFPEEMVESV